MYKSFLLIVALTCYTCFSFTANAQYTVTDSVTLGGDGSQQAYYKLSDSQKTYKPINDWDIAFETQGITYGIWVNEAIGERAYVYPNGDTTNWATVDTNGISGWQALHNSSQAWSIGAFDQNSTAVFDVGWGWYTGPPDHFVIGDSINILVLANGQVKKLWIESLKNKVYHFRYANIDGSGEVEDSIQKLNFDTKNFGYYSFGNHTVVDHEPDMNSWDLLFTKSLTADSLAPNTFAGAFGSVYLNHEVLVTQVQGQDIYNISANNYSPMDSSITVIGNNYLQVQAGLWAPKDTLAYVVADRNGRLFELQFTEVDSSTGKIVFNKTDLTPATGIAAATTGNINLSLYPNPANNVLYVVANSADAGQAEIVVSDMAGKQALQLNEATVSGLNQWQIPVADLAAGLWLVSIKTPTGVVTSKFVKTN